MTPAVELCHVTKLFRPSVHLQRGLKSLLLQPHRLWQRRGALLAVDDVSFAVEPGEFFGVMGRNGAGKSTVLGLIGGILRPTSGSVAARGRIAPLMDFSAGLEPNLTGRENLVLNGVLLGLRRRQVTERMERIIEFSGLADFIDQPVLTYSAGMQMRLGFAVAIHSDPSTLLVDEVLAVGDESFQRRCLARIAELRRQGVTIVLVSHDLELLGNSCDRIAWLDGGRLAELGPPQQVIKRYRDELGRAASEQGAAAVHWRGASAPVRE
jgi:lipopolysaccharide transport system ATP-binding protein